MSVTPLTGQHLEAAADWFLLLAEDPSTETRARWQRWHDAAAAHQLAWQKVEKLQSLLAAAPRQTRLALQAPQRKPRRHALGALGLALAGGLIYALLPARPAAPQIAWNSTLRGERRAIRLPDGGQLWLGSDTRIGVAFHAGARDIYLSHGAMQLTSGSDPQARPLRILTRDGMVRPLGTRLTISEYPTRTALAVQQHAVEVLPLNGATVRIEAGQRVSFSAAGCGQPERAPVAEDAWTKGLIMAMNMPLAEFAEQFALQSGQPVAVAPAVASRRVSGTFQIDAPQRSLQTLADVLAVRLDKTADGWQFRPR
ncbi:FecR domain-containing protein [Duganella sp. sic0402]|uniref:FecR domain-containing protein n=1 Tax=Duganella sp. sic0402 TaxID=2854786 RepID=UPI001C48CA4D|nr:FecR domain-containing protein [Duganella sp. sic0402]MBV7534934.1 FecR domain-containing protein [Duganella sp. sic0402]